MKNETRKMTVHVVLSKEGQKDAIRRGFEGAQQQEIVGEVDIACLDKPYTRIQADGSIVVGDDGGYLGYVDGKDYKTRYHMDVVPSGASEAAEWWERQHQLDAARIEAMDERNAAAKQAREDKIREAIEKDGPRAGIERSYGTARRMLEDVPEDLQPVVQDEIDKMRAESREREEQREREKEEAEAERAAQKQARDEHVLNYVREHGTESQKERLEADLLPIGEAYDACREATFAAYTDFERYQKMTADEVRDECDDYSDVEFSTEDCDTATDEQWRWMKELKNVNKSATVTLRRHIAEIDDEVKEERFGILVELESGPVRFSREFAC